MEKDLISLAADFILINGGIVRCDAIRKQFGLVALERLPELRGFSIHGKWIVFPTPMQVELDKLVTVLDAEGIFDNLMQQVQNLELAVLHGKDADSEFKILWEICAAVGYTQRPLVNSALRDVAEALKLYNEFKVTTADPQQATRHKAAVECAELVKDIVNASGNRQGYSFEELENISNPVMDSFRNAFGPLPGEDY